MLTYNMDVTPESVWKVAGYRVILPYTKTHRL